MGLASSVAARSASLADQLATACMTGDLRSVEAAVAAGASVNAVGQPRGLTRKYLPFVLGRRHDDVAAWLLPHGAEVDCDTLIVACGDGSSLATLRLLIDVGGDLNQSCDSGDLPLFWAIINNRDAKVSMLLSEPSLDLTASFEGYTAHEYALECETPTIADLVAQEVRLVAGTCNAHSRCDTNWGVRSKLPGCKTHNVGTKALC